MHRTVGNVDVFASASLFDVRRRRQLADAVHVAQAQHCDRHHGDGNAEIGRRAGLPVAQHDQQRLRGESDRQVRAVAEQRLHERNIDVYRILVSFLRAHASVPGKWQAQHSHASFKKGLDCGEAPGAAPKNSGRQDQATGDGRPLYSAARAIVWTSCAPA